MTKRNSRTKTAATTVEKIDGVSALPARQHGKRILAHGVEVSNDTWTTGLNNNDLVIGPTGAGKTRYYVKPNLLQMDGSFVVTDTKGSLVKEVGPVLAANGYRVLNIDFTNLEESFGYNPLDFVHVDARSGKVREQDILQIANVLCPVENEREPFWDYATRNLIEILCAFVFEGIRLEDRHLGSVAKLLAHCKASERAEERGVAETALDDFAEEHPESLTARKWKQFRSTTVAHRMYASILGIASEKLDVFTFDAALNVFTAQERIDFKRLGQEKIALFLTVSDTERSLDRLLTLFYAQALQELCEFADDECPGHALDVPVRLYLDDFATNCTIPDFDKTISVIRSRNIAVSVVLQSITQLDTLYGHAASMTIVNGCDHWLYLGGQDIYTAETIAKKANKALESVINMSVGDVWMFERGAQAKKVKRFDLRAHPRYSELPEAGNRGEDAGAGPEAA